MTIQSPSFDGEIVTADIGGTHARFAIAIVVNGVVTDLEHQVTMESVDHASLQIAWETYSRRIDRDLPRDGAIAVAGPVGGDVIHFTNSSWMVRPGLINEKLRLDRFTLVNDFGAIGHAAAALGSDMFGHICGPDIAAPAEGVITIVGPGTGLGVAHVLRTGDGYQVTETEGGHIDFAPRDEIEDRIVAHLRAAHLRVSAERIVAGPGLQAIYHILSKIEGEPYKSLDDKALWDLALSGEDNVAAAAFDRFCLCLGGITGDLAMAQGAKMVVMAGGLGKRIQGRLPSSGFCERFNAKGRFRSLMEQIPVKQLLHEEPGLYGAAAAFVQEHGA